MRKKETVLRRIENPYVGTDCIQYMFAYENAFTLINKKGVLYHQSPYENFYINQYLEEERRNQFPYCHIPVHYQRNGLFEKKVFTNQILEFEQPYLSIKDGNLSEVLVVKDNDQALLFDEPMDCYKCTYNMTYDQLKSFLYENPVKGKLYRVYLDGFLPRAGDFLLPQEEEIYTFVKKELGRELESQCDIITSMRKIGDKISEEASNYGIWLEAYLIQSIKSPDLSLIDFNLPIGTHGSLIVVEVDKEISSVQGIDIEFVKEHNFRVTITDFPVTRYTLEQLKYVSKIVSLKKPKIPLRLNPSVSRKEIKEAIEREKHLILKNENM